ncbi:hypothetical protein [[Pseudopropionibacterium] massiliense]|uniref:hypothetical protein n=1 Tax=[Pseudopropionibacterium] massiliense TaxID=2220000 RepID=UPI001030FCF4|nr:hypothetical protein [[Pseudopropionibacterium] massiliense]
MLPPLDAKPCDRSDFFSMAGSGTLAPGFMVVTWLLIGGTGPVIRMGIGVGALLVGVAVVLLAERQQRGAVTVTT